MTRTITALVVCALVLLTSVSSVLAEPVQSELKSYRCLVPDWSRTSGGVSPALSPDGKTLVYLVSRTPSSEDQVWVLSGLDEYNPGDSHSIRPPGLPEPWQIKCGEPATLEELNTMLSSSNLQPTSGNADWSPDGRSVAFICHGKLFVAGDLDPQTESASVRLLADVGVVPKESLPAGTPDGHSYGEPLLVPRWSPDGKQIAFLRPVPQPGIPNQVCVVDVSTGKETVLARDAVGYGLVWEQPWSPDSRSLAYSSKRPVEDGKGGVSDGIRIVPIAGGASRKVVTGPMAFYPAWSPRGDRLAYSDKVSGFGDLITAIHICNIDGTEPTPIARAAPTAASLTAARVQVRGRLLDVLKRDYPGLFSAAEIKEITSSNISDIDVMAIILIAEGLGQAKETGGVSGQKVDAALKRWPVRGEHRFNASAGIRDAMNALPDEKRRALQERAGKAAMEVVQPLTSLRSVDMNPSWSPDGGSLAFTRWDPTDSVRLIAAEVLTGRSRTVFESSAIGNATWTRDSKSLVLWAKRNLAYKGQSYRAEILWTELITLPSYPEIWVLDLK